MTAATAATTTPATTATRGRKPKALLLHAHPEVDQAKIDNAMTVMRDIAQGAQELAVQIGYDGVMTPAALEDGIRFYQGRTVESLLEMGKRLLLLKEITPHGEFKAHLEVLNIDYTMAKRFMSATVKFSKGATSHLLGAAGSTSKLLELAMLDDDEIQQLEAGESVRGIDLDDVDTMTVRELRAALRESRDENIATAALLRDKNAKLDAAHAKQQRIKTLPPDQVLAELRREVTARADDAEGAIVGQLRQGFLALYKHHEGQQLSGNDDINIGSSDIFMAGIIGQLMTNLIALRDEFSLPEIGPEGVPEWVSAE